MEEGGWGAFGCEVMACHVLSAPHAVTLAGSTLQVRAHALVWIPPPQSALTGRPVFAPLCFHQQAPCLVATSLCAPGLRHYD
jgi:hypothetical protein